MAVIIHNTPQLYTPSDNPVNWTFSSDQTDQDNFVFVIEIYVNDVLTANDLVFPDNGIYGRYDASSYASNNTQIPDITDDLFTDANNYATIRITVIERYGTPPVDQAAAAAANINVFKARLEDNDFADWDQTLYNITVGGAKIWMSNFPGGGPGEILPLVRRENEQFRIMVLNNLADITDFRFQLFDADINLIAEYTALLATSAFKITILNLTPAIVIANTTLTQANFDDSVRIRIDSSSQLQSYLIDLNDACVFQHYRRVHFLTELGTIESLSFDLISKEKSKVESFGYRNQFGEWSGEDFNYTKEQGRDIDYAKVATREMDIESDWLPEAVQHWLVRNLYESPVVFVEEVEGESTILLRRKIINTSWMDMYHENDMLFKERITLKLPTKTSMIV